MNRVLLDTNIFGEIVRCKDVRLVREAVDRKLNRNVLMYGSETVRWELRKTRKTPKHVRRRTNVNLRSELLKLYDLLIGEAHTIRVTEQVKELANHYLRVYLELVMKAAKKEHEKEELYRDCLIIAAAALKGLDVVYSQDNNTMFSDQAVKAYDIVNSIRSLKTPSFYGYNEFKKELNRWFS